MKKIEGKWIAPFEFSDSQRIKLLKVWPRRKDQQKSTTYIDQVQSHIELWLSIVEEENTSAPQTRTHANKLLNRIDSLRQAFDELPEDFISELDANVMARLHVQKYKYEYEVAKNAIKTIVNTPHESQRKTYPSLEEVYEILNELLVLVKDASASMSVLKGRPGPDKNYEKLLVKWLAEDYENVFGKAPSSSNGSTFRRLASELSSILGYELGANIIQELIYNRKYSGNYHY